MTQPFDVFVAKYEYDDNVWWRLSRDTKMDMFDSALERINELTTQRDDARRMVVASGYFQDQRGEDYDLDSDNGNPEWRADPVGPVAWDRPVEQR
jgi:hypothetical protein